MHGQQNIKKTRYIIFCFYEKYFEVIIARFLLPNNVSGNYVTLCV